MQGTASVLKRLDAIKKQVEQTPRELELRTRFLAMRMVGEYANYSNGSEDVSVTVEEIPKGFSIVGSGEDIFFVEFGTGLFYSRNPMPHPYNEPASWSATHAQYLTNKEKLAKYHGYWPHNGKWTSGQPSANVFYEAGKTVTEKFPGYLVDFINEAIKS